MEASLRTRWGGGGRIRVRIRVIGSCILENNSVYVKTACVKICLSPPCGPCFKQQSSFHRVVVPPFSISAGILREYINFFFVRQSIHVTKMHFFNKKNLIIKKRYVSRQHNFCGKRNLKIWQ